MKKNITWNSVIERKDTRSILSMLSLVDKSKRGKTAVFVSKFRVYFLNSVRSIDHHKLSLIWNNKQLESVSWEWQKLKNSFFLYKTISTIHPTILILRHRIFLRYRKFNALEIIVIAREKIQIKSKSTTTT